MEDPVVDLVGRRTRAQARVLRLGRRAGGQGAGGAEARLRRTAVGPPRRSIRPASTAPSSASRTSDRQAQLRVGSSASIADEPRPRQPRSTATRRPARPRERDRRGSSARSASRARAAARRGHRVGGGRRAAASVTLEQRGRRTGSQIDGGVRRAAARGAAARGRGTPTAASAACATRSKAVVQSTARAAGPSIVPTARRARPTTTPGRRAAPGRTSRRGVGHARPGRRSRPARTGSSARSTMLAARPTQPTVAHVVRRDREPVRPRALAVRAPARRPSRVDRGCVSKPVRPQPGLGPAPDVAVGGAVERVEEVGEVGVAEPVPRSGSALTPGQEVSSPSQVTSWRSTDVALGVGDHVEVGERGVDVDARARRPAATGWVERRSSAA